MTLYQFTPEASDDLFDIWSFIAEGSVTAADRVEEAIYTACALVASTPEVGRVRKELTDLPVRFWLVQPYQNYFIVYDPQTKPSHGGSRRFESCSAHHPSLIVFEIYPATISNPGNQVHFCRLFI